MQHTWVRSTAAQSPRRLLFHRAIRSARSGNATAVRSCFSRLTIISSPSSSFATRGSELIKGHQ
jgi:hypothetical protein